MNVNKAGRHLGKPIPDRLDNTTLTLWSLVYPCTTSKRRERLTDVETPVFTAVFRAYSCLTCFGSSPIQKVLSTLLRPFLTISLK